MGAEERASSLVTPEKVSRVGFHVMPVLRSIPTGVPPVLKDLGHITACPSLLFPPL